MLSEVLIKDGPSRKSRHGVGIVGCVLQDIPGALLPDLGLGKFSDRGVRESLLTGLVRGNAAKTCGEWLPGYFYFVFLILVR